MTLTKKGRCICGSFLDWRPDSCHILLLDELAQLGVDLERLIVFRKLSKVLVVKNGLKEDGFSFDGTLI